MYESKPWLKFYGGVPESIDYPEVTVFEALKRTGERCPDAVAYDFLDRTATYAELIRDIDRFSDALFALGMRRGDRITIAMPTSQQGVIGFYAANRIGAVASMIHPLSPPREVRFYLEKSRSRVALTLDAFYSTFREARENTALETLILTRIPDYLGPLKRLGFALTQGRRISRVPPDPSVVWWRDLLRAGHPVADLAPSDPDAVAALLYSGGTTGRPKGIMLSNRNFIAEGMQVAAWGELDAGDSMLAIMPIFHGFGLGVCVNAAFMGGARSILVPQFTAESVARLIRKKRPAVITGVPTLYDALARDPVFRGADLGCLRAAFCGADTLPRTVKERFEDAVRKAGGEVTLREGYGLTEAVTAIMAMPLHEYRESSIGIPFPDMLAKIVELDGDREVAPGTDGEICLHGPAVMQGYLDDPEETARALRNHPDGRTWLHTGDVGCMDQDGFFYFKLREKRMIKSSGMNVYPAQVEDVLYEHPDVLEACVIGLPDRSQVERVKGFVVLRGPSAADPEAERRLIEHCRERLIKWSCPREIEIRDELPKTLLGKIAFDVLRREELARLAAAGEHVGDD
jgi:long-chain acyl-CoA synthetase